MLNISQAGIEFTKVPLLTSLATDDSRRVEALHLSSILFGLLRAKLARTSAEQLSMS